MVGMSKQENEDSNEVSMPKKRFFRSRAHCNPLSHNDSFLYPINPSLMDWSTLYPGVPAAQRIVRILDMGMGFGGLTVALAELFPEKLVLGMEIRAKVIADHNQIKPHSVKTFLLSYRYANMYDFE